MNYTAKAERNCLAVYQAVLPLRWKPLTLAV